MIDPYSGVKCVGEELVNVELDDFDNYISSANELHDRVYNSSAEQQSNVRYLDVINYKYNEDQIIKDLQAYVDTTYAGDDAHYAKSKIETLEEVIDDGYGMAFCLGNVKKYTKRYGKKKGYNRQDLMKVLHYSLMALYVHDECAEGDCYVKEEERTG